MQHGYYRPAGMARFAGALDADGAPLAVACHYAGGGDGESVFMPYTIADKARRRATRSIRSGPGRGARCSTRSTASSRSRSSTRWRTPRRRIPFTFRRDLMTDDPRFKAVLERVAAMADWRHPAARRAKGAASITESFGSIVGEVAHVAVSPGRHAEGQAGVRGGRLRRRRQSPIPRRRRSRAASSSGCRRRCWARSRSPRAKVVESNFHDYEMIHLVDAPADQRGVHPLRHAPGRTRRAGRAAGRGRGDQRDLRGDRNTRAPAADQGRQLPTTTT